MAVTQNYLQGRDSESKLSQSTLLKTLFPPFFKKTLPSILLSILSTSAFAIDINGNADENSVTLIANNSKVNVSGDFNLRNNVSFDFVDGLPDINKVYQNALISASMVHVGGDFNLIGDAAGPTSLQVINGSASQKLSVDGDMNLTSSVSGNFMNTILGEHSLVDVGGGINISSVFLGGGHSLYR